MPVDIHTNNLLKMEMKPAGADGDLMFHKFDPPSLALQNINHHTWDNTGKPMNHSGGGKHPIHGEWGIERVVDHKGQLFKWFKDTNEKGREDTNAKKDCTVTILDTEEMELRVWNLKKTTILSYTQSAVDANAHSILTESVRLYSDEIELEVK